MSSLFELSLLLLIHLSLGVTKQVLQNIDLDSSVDENTIDTHRTVDCGSIVSNMSHILIKNPHHPEPTYTKSICETVIVRASPSVNQLSIKFRQFELYRSSYHGECLHDRFAIYSDLNELVAPTICGSHTGETLKVPFLSNRTSLILSITTSDLDHDRFWSIEITQDQ